ncbi:MAG: hypothetical protein F6J93_09985 [Oscillatoria sp. SIO1A7]|nr:hypothetical protein [Oscillatoria sp. SIO1A7]
MGGSDVGIRPRICCVTRTSWLRQRSREKPKNKVFLRFGEGIVRETGVSQIFIFPSANAQFPIPNSQFPFLLP